MKYKCGYKYITGEVEKVNIPEWEPGSLNHKGFIKLAGRWIEISEGYAWDGASFILFKWFGTPDNWKTPSLIHDALYQLMREGAEPETWRKTADGIFYRLLRERSVWWINAKFAYWAVRLGGNYFMRHGAKMNEAP